MKLLNEAFEQVRPARRTRPVVARRPEVLTSGDAFEVLGVRPGAGDLQIDDAYRAAVASWHPDLNPDVDRDAGFRAVRRLDDAYRKARASASRQRG